MFTDKEFNLYTQRILDIYDPIFQDYLVTVGEHVKDIGTMTRTDVHRLTEIARMTGNSREIASELALATGKANAEIERMFEEMAQDYYAFSEQFYDAKGMVQTPWADNATLQRIVKAQVTMTQGTLANLSKTTASELLKNPPSYKKLIDTAVRQTSLGTSSYQTAIRRTLKTAESDGISCINFDTGYRRRLDSQIRMNVLEGVRTNAIAVADAVGEEYGADGYEISAHGLCAEDHVHIQGKQYAKKAYEELNASLKRSIGTLNCRHFVFPILMGISTPANSEEELAELERSSMEPVTIGDVTKTKYEWTQEQRRLETEIRKQKDIAVAAASSGDDALRREAQAKINAYKAQHDAVTKQAGLTYEPQRMTVSGFRAVKAEKQLNLTQSGGIINEQGISGKQKHATDENTVDLAYIHSKEYKNKFSDITDNEAVNKTLYIQTKAMLTHRNGTYFEDLHLIDANTGDLLASETSTKEENIVFYSDKTNQVLKEHHGPIVSLHNHGTNNPPIGSDFVSSGYRGYALGVIACHDGTVYTYKSGNAPFYTMAFDEKVKRYLNENFSAKESIEKTLRQFEKSHGITWEERK